ncbi:polysaccharide pyruvyl transferase family protein [Fusicatenibacter saccharivorans]|uniref:polysaccharide pyruvyl transferase family protein n=1 Tax=Fusicatenibacter saccharivorans TaxID=1150298 RepID=UPI003F9247A5
MTTDYKRFVQEILQSEVVISSALHGIILAESYKVPTIFLREQLNKDIKFDDWYFSTQRYNYKYITRLEEALSCDVNCIPDIEDMQRNLLESFPYDLWR